jgi:DNA-binding NarL/FixJ family response regulator
MTRILLIEDDKHVASAVAKALESATSSRWQVRHVATAHEALRAVENAVGQEAFDVAIVDLGLPDGPGVDLIRAFSQREPPLPALAFTIFDDRAHVLEVVRAGARGYLLKEDSIQRLHEYINECLDGQTPVSSRVAGFLFELCKPEPGVVLTPREQDVLQGLARGLSYAECARKLEVSVGTVQTHVKNLYRKLDVTTRSGAAAWAKRHLP